MFTMPENSPPLFHLPPGNVHRHGPAGFRADRLSDGLPPLDLAREEARALLEWATTVDRVGLLYIAPWHYATASPTVLRSGGLHPTPRLKLFVR